MQSIHKRLQLGSSVRAAVVLPAALVLMLVACTPGGGAASTTVNVTGADFAFVSDKVAVPAGKVHFVLSNKSTANPPELWVYPQNQPRLQEMVRVKESGQDVA